MPRLRDWHSWLWPVLAGGFVLALTIAAVITAPQDTEHRVQPQPRPWVKAAARAAAAHHGDTRPVAVEWVSATHGLVAEALELEDDRPAYKRDVVILVQGAFGATAAWSSTVASPGASAAPSAGASPAPAPATWLVLIYSAGNRKELQTALPFAERPSLTGLPPLKRFEW